MLFLPPYRTGSGCPDIGNCRCDTIFNDRSTVADVVEIIDVFIDTIVGIVFVGRDHAVALRVFEQVALGIEIRFVALPPHMAGTVLDLSDHAARIVGVDAREQVPVRAEVVRGGQVVGVFSKT